jgi:hypothetical protein
MTGAAVRYTSALSRLPAGTLAVRYSLAQTTLRFGQSHRCRIRALAEIDAIRRELRRREAA